MIYMKLEYMEMDCQFGLFAAVTDNEKMKDHRTAVRIPVMGRPCELVTALRAMADDIERKFA